MCECVCVCIVTTGLHLLTSGGFSYTIWDKWEVRGHEEFKLSDFLKRVKVCVCVRNCVVLVDACLVRPLSVVGCRSCINWSHRWWCTE